MCHVSCVIFAASNISREEINGKSVIDVGSYDYNGNLYPLLKQYNPEKFVGTDMLAGPGVDVVCRAEDLTKVFGQNSFDVVVSSELMEHARNWREVISNIKNICKPGGLIVITTRSYGFGYHAYPYDYWRYEYEDMKEIFADCDILAIEKDPQAPGIFIKVRKPINFKEKDLANVSLYSMIHGTRISNIDPVVETKFLNRCRQREAILKIVKNVENFFFKFGHKLLFGSQTHKVV